jgi:eukaryotic-like serine/threonine-protein kinase
VTEANPTNNHEHWEQVEQLFNSTCSLDAASREDLLTKSTHDPRVIADVRLLLDSFDSKDSFMEEPVCGIGLSIINSEPELIIGETINRYQLLRLVGRGGMSEVYLAQDPLLGRQVALKMLSERITGNDEQVRRFEYEARAASAISHPNVAHIYEIGESHGRHYITMEFVIGDTLREVLRQGPPNRVRTVEIVIQVLTGLKAAHDTGVVHRDIKPENIICGEDGYVKVVDFGIAKLVQQESGAGNSGVLSSLHTGPELLMGTWDYMSPEQLRKQRVDRRTDLWSTGVVLYEMATGNRPFRSGGFSNVVISILEDEPPGLGDTKVPLSLRKVIAKALTKDLQQRYQTADEMLADLRAIPDTDLRAGDSANEKEKKREPSVYRPNTLRQRLNTIETSLSEAWSRFPFAVGWRWIVLSVLLVIASVVGAYSVWSPDPPATQPVREFDTRFERLNLLAGEISSTAISPDGKYVASVTTDAGKHAIHIMELATSSDLTIVSPSGIGYTGLTFSTDSTYLYYLEIQAQSGTLYRVSKLGGAQRKILENVNTPVGFSHDGSQIAFVRHNKVDDTPELTIASANGTHERILAKRYETDANTFVANPKTAGPMWSPDGKKVACPTLNLSRTPMEMNLEIIDVATGQARRLNTQPWFDISGVTWLKDGRALVMSVKNSPPSSSQLIWISYPEGVTRKITNDPNNYSGVTSTSDSNQILSLSVEENSSVWLIPPLTADAVDSYNVKPLSGVSDVRRQTTGALVYSLFDGEYANLWTQDANGSVRQLTFERSHNYRPTISSDGRYIVWVTSRDGLGSIWRMNVDGTNQTRLTFGSYEDMPTVTPDSKWVIYRTGRELRKVPIEGGDSLKLIEANALYPVVSPDGRMLAFLTDTPGNKRWMLKVLDLATQQVLKGFDLPDATNPFVGLQWSPRGDGLIFVSTQGAANLWRQPLDGSQPHQLTRFKDAEIQSFSWASLDSSIVCVRKARTTVSVLIRLF